MHDDPPFKPGDRVHVINAFRHIRAAGCVAAAKAMEGQGGSSWLMLACLDRLVEVGDLVEVPTPEGTWAQHRIFRTPASEEG